MVECDKDPADCVNNMRLFGCALCKHNKEPRSVDNWRPGRLKMFAKLDAEAKKESGFNE